MAVGASALAIAAGLTVVQSVGTTDPDGRPKSIVPGLQGAPAANAAEALERAALVAEARASTVPTPRPNQWIYAKERVSFSFGPTKGGVNQHWERVDGKGTAFVDEHGKLRFRPVPKPPSGRHARKLPPAPWTYPTVTTLPTDPDALLRLASRYSGGPDPDGEAFDLFTAILRRGGLLPPKLEAAIYRAMQRLSGVTLVRNGGTVGGHETLALARTNGSLRDEVLLDRTTFTYRGLRATIVKEDVTFERNKRIEPVGHAKGLVILFERLTTAVVDKAGQMP